MVGGGEREGAAAPLHERGDLGGPPGSPRGWASSGASASACSQDLLATVSNRVVQVHHVVFGPNYAIRFTFFC